MPPRFFSAARVDGVRCSPKRQMQQHPIRRGCHPLETNVPDNLAVNGARDTVLQLEVHLGDGVLGEDRGVRDVTWSLSASLPATARWLKEGVMSWLVRIAADSTMLRMVNLLMALSLGVHREQLLQRMGLTWPRPFLLRPLFFLCTRESGQHLMPWGQDVEDGDGDGVENECSKRPAQYGRGLLN